MVQNKRDKTTKQSLQALREKNAQLEKESQQQEEISKQLERNLYDMERTLLQLQKSRLTKWVNPTNIKQSLRNAAAYILGKRDLKRLYSSTYKRKQASNN